MPRRKTPKLRLKFLEIPIEKQIHLKEEPARPKSIFKKYKNLRFAKFIEDIDDSHEFKIDIKNECEYEISNIIYNNINNSEKNEKEKDGPKKHRIIKKDEVLDANSEFQTNNISVDDKFDIFFSSLTENFDDEIIQSDSFDSWDCLM